MSYMGMCRRIGYGFRRFSILKAAIHMKAVFWLGIIIFLLIQKINNNMIIIKYQEIRGLGKKSESQMGFEKLISNPMSDSDFFGVYVLPNISVISYYIFNANISFTLQAIKNLYAHITYLCFGPFCRFFGDFQVYLEINSFPHRISKIHGNRRF